MEIDAGKSLDRLGVNIQPGVVLRALAIAQKQIVEIAKCVSTNSKLIVMSRTCPAACQGGMRDMRLRSKPEDDAADCSQIIAVKLSVQPDKQTDLLWAEDLTVRAVIIRNFNATVMAATNSFDILVEDDDWNIQPMD